MLQQLMYRIWFWGKWFDRKAIEWLDGLTDRIIPIYCVMIGFHLKQLTTHPLAQTTWFDVVWMMACFIALAYCIMRYYYCIYIHHTICQEVKRMRNEEPRPTETD